MGLFCENKKIMGPAHFFVVIFMDVYESRTIKDTFFLAGTLAKILKGGEVIAMSGSLGSGKTTFTQALAANLNFKQNLNSPTFTIMKIYSRSGPYKIKKICHVDAYRLNNSAEIMGIGIIDYLGKENTITIIEWAEKVSDALWINFEINSAGLRTLKTNWPLT